MNSIAVPLDSDTHVCVNGVHYCLTCNQLYVPDVIYRIDNAVREHRIPATAWYMSFIPGMGCWACHAAACGHWNWFGGFGV